jgi:uncharacterized RmlC-like cupin family protein
VTGSQSVHRVGADERRVADPTPGMSREQALIGDGLWAGIVRTEPTMQSGWHHHGDHVTAIYVLSGVMRLQSGPGGRDVTEGRAGDFLFVPRQAVHRETNPSDRPCEAVVVRSGHGPTTINVDEPLA